MTQVHSIFFINDDIDISLLQNTKSGQNFVDERQIVTRKMVDSNTELLTLKDGKLVVLYGNGQKGSTLNIDEINLENLAKAVKAAHTGAEFNSNTQITFNSHGMNTSDGCSWKLHSNTSKSGKGETISVEDALNKVSSTIGANWKIPEGLSFHIMSCYGGKPQFSDAAKLTNIKPGTTVMLHAGNTPILNIRAEQDITEILSMDFSKGLESRSELLSKTIASGCGPLSLVHLNSANPRIDYKAPTVTELVNFDTHVKAKSAEYKGLAPAPKAKIDVLKNLLGAGEFVFTSTQDVNTFVDQIFPVIEHQNKIHQQNLASFEASRNAIEDKKKESEQLLRQNLDNVNKAFEKQKLEAEANLAPNTHAAGVSRAQEIYQEDMKNITSSCDQGVQNSKKAYDQVSEILSDALKDLETKVIEEAEIHAQNVAHCKQQVIGAVLRSAVYKDDTASSVTAKIKAFLDKNFVTPGQFVTSLDDVAESIRPDIYTSGMPGLVKVLHACMDGGVIQEINLPKFVKKFADKKAQEGCEDFAIKTIEAVRSACGVDKKIEGKFQEEITKLVKALGVDDTSLIASLEHRWEQYEQEGLDIAATITAPKYLKIIDDIKHQAEALKTPDDVEKLASDIKKYEKLPDFIENCKLHLSEVFIIHTTATEKVNVDFAADAAVVGKMNELGFSTARNVENGPAIASNITVKMMNGIVSSRSIDKSNSLIKDAAKFLVAVKKSGVCTDENITQAISSNKNDASYLSAMLDKLQDYISHPETIDQIVSESIQLSLPLKAAQEVKLLDDATSASVKSSEHHTHKHTEASATEKSNQAMIDDLISSGPSQDLYDALMVKYNKATTVKPKVVMPQTLSSEQIRQYLSAEENYGKLCVYEEFAKIAQLFEELAQANMTEQMIGLVQYFETAGKYYYNEYSVIRDEYDRAYKALTYQNPYSYSTIDSLPVKERALYDQYVAGTQDNRYLNFNSSCYGMLIAALFLDDKEIEAQYGNSLKLSEGADITVGSGNFIKNYNDGKSDPKFTLEEVKDYAKHTRGFFSVMVNLYSTTSDANVKDSIVNLLDALIRNEDSVKENFIRALSRATRDHQSDAMKLAKEVLIKKGYNFDEPVVPLAHEEEVVAIVDLKKQTADLRQKLMISDEQAIQKMAKKDSDLPKKIEAAYNDQGMNPVHIAIQDGNAAKVTTYKDIGVDITLPTQDGRVVESLIPDGHESEFENILSGDNIIDIAYALEKKLEKQFDIDGDLENYAIYARYVEVVKSFIIKAQLIMFSVLDALIDRTQDTLEHIAETFSAAAQRIKGYVDEYKALIADEDAIVSSLGYENKHKYDNNVTKAYNQLLSDTLTQKLESDEIDTEGFALSNAVAHEATAAARAIQLDLVATLENDVDSGDFTNIGDIFNHVEGICNQYVANIGNIIGNDTDLI